MDAGGGDGVISVTANVAPAAMAQMCELALAGNIDEAEQIDQQLAALHRDLFVEANPVPVKWALQKMGKIPAGIRLPLVELNSQYHVKVLDAIQQAGIELAKAA